MRDLGDVPPWVSTVWIQPTVQHQFHASKGGSTRLGCDPTATGPVDVRRRDGPASRTTPTTMPRELRHAISPGPREEQLLVGHRLLILDRPTGTALTSD